MKTFYALTGSKYPPELSYVMGVLCGDACIYRVDCIHYLTGKPSFTWRIDMAVADREFADRFADSCGKVLKRPENRNVKVMPPTLRNKGRKPLYRVAVASASFGEWWKNANQRTRLRYATASPENFLRGLYDSNGNLSFGAKNNPVVRIVTCEPETLEIAIACLDKLGIGNSSRVFSKAGTLTNLGPRNMDVLVVCPKPVRKFLSLVGSSIPRKNL